MTPLGPAAARPRRNLFAATVGGWIASYRVAIGVCVAFAATALWAKAALGPDTPSDVVARFGYGLPAFEDGRWWTIATGFPLQDTLAVLPQPIMVVALVLLERVAFHWRTLAVFVGGHVVAVLAVAALLWFLDDSTNEWVRAMSNTLDVGCSNGAFACLGAWTAFLRAPARRRARLGISCYLAVMLLFSGHIYDLSHPVGWIAGVAVGHRMTHIAVRPFDSSVFRSREFGWLIVVGAVGIAYGLFDAWHGSGTGGPFGWGPGSLG